MRLGCLRSAFPCSVDGSRPSFTVPKTTPVTSRSTSPATSRAVDAFERQQVALVREAAGEAGERTAGTDDTVARGDDRDRVAADRRTDRPHRLRVVDSR